MTETTAAIVNNQVYLDYVKQGVVGILMNSLQSVSGQLGLTPNDTLAVFFNPENKGRSMSVMFNLMKAYIQTCCDEFCTIYESVYITPRIPLKEALDLNGSQYVFSNFNKIFKDSRTNTISGPKHLNCLSTCTAFHFMPMLFSTIFTVYEKTLMGGSQSSRNGNWSVAERNIVREYLKLLVQRTVDWLNVNKQDELKQMPFVCKEDDSCNQNWDLFNFPTDQQAIAVENFQKFWSELEQ